MEKVTSRSRIAFKKERVAKMLDKMISKAVYRMLQLLLIQKIAVQTQILRLTASKKSSNKSTIASECRLIQQQGHF